MNISSLRVERVGQIRCADLKFGDLTVLAGPQATGKSIFLQRRGRGDLDRGTAGEFRSCRRSHPKSALARKLAAY